MSRMGQINIFLKAFAPVQSPPPNLDQTQTQGWLRSLDTSSLLILIALYKTHMAQLNYTNMYTYTYLYKYVHSSG
jgi:hypothetical protein